MRQCSTSTPKVFKLLRSRPPGATRGGWYMAGPRHAALGLAGGSKRPVISAGRERRCVTQHDQWPRRLRIEGIILDPEEWQHNTDI